MIIDEAILFTGGAIVVADTAHIGQLFFTQAIGGVADDLITGHPAGLIYGRTRDDPELGIAALVDDKEDTLVVLAPIQLEH